MTNERYIMWKCILLLGDTFVFRHWSFVLRSWSFVPRSSGENGVEDLAVAGAAADISAQRGLDLVDAGARLLVEQLRAGHQHAGDAEAALHRRVGDKGLLERVEPFGRRM